MFDKSIIDTKRADLDRVKDQLKTEFFGLDTIIDRVMERLTAWYIFPSLITRPVIVNLWGMTGVGKTQLVRRISSLLNFSDRFVEVVMDGGSSHGYWSSTLASILRESKIEEGAPGLLLLDEIQRFRTIDQTGADIKVERYQDIWTLLSDGKFSSDSSLFAEIEMALAEFLYRPEEGEKEPGKETPTPVVKKRELSPWQARSLKRTLRLSQPLHEIMAWRPEHIMQVLQEQANRESWEYDYTKLVIFISGNLDSAFTGASSIEDSDTDADFYHEVTKNISISDVKKSLAERFRPEQIARLGNNHIIYPSMSRASYEKLIAATCQKYLTEMTSISGVSFELHKSLLDAIYDNSVFPTQGTRPVFSSIHLIFSGLLVAVTFWAIEHDLHTIKLEMYDRKNVLAIGNDRMAMQFPVELNVTDKKERTSPDYKTVVGVHEAGHAIVFALLTGTAPFEVKINVASFNGGYVLQQPESSKDGITKQWMRDGICVMLAGRAAEEMVFGDDMTTTGAEYDIYMATTRAHNYVRTYGMGETLGKIGSEAADKTTWMTNVEDTNPEIRGLLAMEFVRAQTMLKDHTDYFTTVAKTLLKSGQLNQEAFIKLSEPFIALKKSRHVNFVAGWEQFLRDCVPV
jgi:hypothetical protein